MRDGNGVNVYLSGGPPPGEAADKDESQYSVGVTSKSLYGSSQMKPTPPG